MSSSSSHLWPESDRRIHLFRPSSLPSICTRPSLVVEFCEESIRKHHLCSKSGDLLPHPSAVRSWSSWSVWAHFRWTDYSWFWFFVLLESLWVRGSAECWAALVQPHWPWPAIKSSTPSDWRNSSWRKEKRLHNFWCKTFRLSTLGVVKCLSATRVHEQTLKHMYNFFPPLKGFVVLFWPSVWADWRGVELRSHSPQQNLTTQLVLLLLLTLLKTVWRRCWTHPLGRRWSVCWWMRVHCSLRRRIEVLVFDWNRSTPSVDFDCWQIVCLSKNDRKFSI